MTYCSKLSQLWGYDLENFPLLMCLFHFQLFKLQFYNCLLIICMHFILKTFRYRNFREIVEKFSGVFSGAITSEISPHILQIVHIFYIYIRLYMYFRCIHISRACILHNSLGGTVMSNLSFLWNLVNDGFLYIIISLTYLSNQNLKYLPRTYVTDKVIVKDKSG